MADSPILYRVRKLPRPAMLGLVKGWYSRSEFMRAYESRPGQGNRVFLGGVSAALTLATRYLLVGDIVCVSCGAHGDIFALVQTTSRHCNASRVKPHYYVSIYAEDGRGGLVMMTIDHIVPRSKGGSKYYHNTQPMCDVCNNAKGDKYDGKL